MRAQRNILGALTICMAVAALWLNFLQPELAESYAALAAGSLRMTPVLAVLWLALPETRKSPGVWLFIAVAVCAVAFLFRPGRAGIKVLVPALILLGILTFLRRFTTALMGKEPR